MYEDTLIIVTSDHGYLLGDRGLFGKNYMHNYNELAAIPLMVRDPKGRRVGERTQNISQNIDVMPTILDYHQIAIPEEVRGTSWYPIMEGNPNGNTHVIYGAHGVTVNLTDGHHTYFRAPNEKNYPLYEYAGIPTTIRHYIGEKDPASIEMGRFLERTQYPVYKTLIQVPAILDGLGDMSAYTKDSLLFDIEKDPQQLMPLEDEQLEAEMIATLKNVMEKMDTPKEQFQRLNLE